MRSISIFGATGSIGASALRMLARVLHEEARTLPVRVQMLAVDSPVRCDANAATARAQWPDVDAIADHALRLVDGAANADVALVRFRPPLPKDGTWPSIRPERASPSRMLAAEC